MSATTNSKDTMTPAKFGWRRTLRLCQKELREILRDRRTIITLVLMPLLVYPILAMIFQRFALTSGISPESPATAAVVVAVEDEETGHILQQYLQVGYQLSNEIGTADDEGVREMAKNLKLVATDNLEATLDDGRVDVAIRIDDYEPPKTPNEIPTAQLTVLHRENSSHSEAAVRFIERCVHAVNDIVLIERLTKLNESAEMPVRLTIKSAQPEQQTGVSLSLASLIPLILVLMTITGAVYPAIDVTAGERERGTMEALIAAPVPRFNLLIAKYIAVVTVALLTAAANVSAMTATLFSTGLGAAIFGEAALTPKTLAGIFLLMVLFAAFFAAVLLAVTSFARSFKEAQAYLIPIMLLSLAPGIVSLSPGIKLQGVLSVTPLINIVVLARDALQGTVEAAPAAAAVISTLFFAVGALGVAARIFGTDAVLYGNSVSWSEWLGRPDKLRPAASLSGALLFLAVLFPSYVLLANLLSRLSTQELATQLGVASLVTIFLFGMFPWVVAMGTRIRIISAFRVQGAGPLSFLAAALLGFSLWPLMHELVLFQKAIGIFSLDKQIAATRSLIEQLTQVSSGYLILTMAIVPAFFEELFFRGFLFSAFKRQASKWRTIFFTALLFGLFHVVATSGLVIVRFLPSTAMGIVLGWVCWKTNSVFPGILLHACHNGLLVTIGHYQDWLESKRVGIQEQAHLPAYWITFAVIGVIAGVLTMRFASDPIEEVEPV